MDQPDIDSVPGNGDPGEDNMDSATILVDTLVDLILVKTVDPELISVGGEATFTIEVINLGPSPATQIEVRTRGGRDQQYRRRGAPYLRADPDPHRMGTHLFVVCMAATAIVARRKYGIG